MIDRFLRYSLENEKKIAAVLLEDGKPVKKNFLVTALLPEEDAFMARVGQNKIPERFSIQDVLTADYARGDHGELE